MIDIEEVKKRLLGIGYVYADSDAWMLSFISSKVTNEFKSATNQLEVPTGLTESAIDRVCGEFLFAKKASGNIVGFNLDMAVKSIQEGDTNVTFAVGAGSKTEEQRLDEVIAYLINPNIDFASYRRVQW